MKISKITIKSLFGIKEWSGDGKNIELVGDNGTGKTFLTEISVSFRLITRERSSCARDIRAILFKTFTQRWSVREMSLRK